MFQISIILRDHPELLENSKQVVKLLDLLCEKMMKLKATNEVMAVKFHYQGSIIKECAKCWEENNKKLDMWFKTYGLDSHTRFDLYMYMYM